MHEHNFSLDNIITSGLVVCTAYLTPVITKQKDQCYQNEIITGIAINRAVIPNTEELNDIEQDRPRLPEIVQDRRI